MREGKGENDREVARGRKNKKRVFLPMMTYLLYLSISYFSLGTRCTA